MHRCRQLLLVNPASGAASLFSSSSVLRFDMSVVCGREKVVEAKVVASYLLLLLRKRDGLRASLRWQRLSAPAVRVRLERRIFPHVLDFCLIRIFSTDRPIITTSVDAIRLKIGLNDTDQQATRTCSYLLVCCHRGVRHICLRCLFHLTSTSPWCQ